MLLTQNKIFNGKVLKYKLYRVFAGYDPYINLFATIHIKLRRTSEEHTGCALYT